MRSLVALAYDVWATANHYWTYWPRIRVAASALLVVGAVVAAGAWLLVALERRAGVCSRVSARVGTGGLVFVGCLAVYLAAGGGHLYTPDEWAAYAVAAGLATHGVPMAYADEPYPLHYIVREGRPAPGGSERGNPKYPVLPSVLAAPLYAVARLTGPPTAPPGDAFPFENRALPLVPLLYGPIVGAAATAVTFLAARQLGYAPRVGIAVAVVFALGSLAFPYAKTILNMTPAAGFLVGSLWCVLRAADATAGRLRWSAAAGACAGLALASRYETVLFAAPLAPLVMRGTVVRGERVRRALVWLAACAAITVPAVLGTNLFRFGHAFDFGYGGESASFSEKPWYGYLGLVLSPGCGLVPHTPILALGIVALVWLWEDAPAAALAVGSVVLLAFGYYGGLNIWCSPTTWGPRYLTTIGPFLALPLAALFGRLHGGARNPFVWLVVGALVVWSLATNLLAVLIDFNRGWQDHWAHNLSTLDVIWLPYFSGITTHLRLLREWLLDGVGGVDLYFAYQLGEWGWVVIAALSLFGLGCWWAAWLGSGVGDRATPPRSRRERLPPGPVEARAARS